MERIIILNSERIRSALSQKQGTIQSEDLGGRGPCWTPAGHFGWERRVQCLSLAVGSSRREDTTAHAIRQDPISMELLVTRMISDKRALALL